MIRDRTLGPACTFTPCSRGGSGAANTRREPGCLRKQNWPVNSAAGPAPPRGRCGHSSATGWPGRFSEEGTYRPARMLIQASHDAPSRLRRTPHPRRRLHLRPALRTRGSTGIISRTQSSRTFAHAADRVELSQPGKRWHADRCDHSTAGRQGAAALPSPSTCEKAVSAASDAEPWTPPVRRCGRRRAGKRHDNRLQQMP